MSETRPAPPTIDDLSALIDARLNEIVSARELPFYQMMGYHLGWESAPGHQDSPISNSRDHGVACLLACQAAGGDVEVALPAACSVELVDSFSQIHDDVQGGHPKRGSRDAVWWVWGPAQAINVGDGMHALARLAMFQLAERGVPAATTFRAVQMIDEAGLALCEGRFQDLEAQERIDTSISSYMEMAASKTGALYSCAMALGGLVASADETVVGALGECGAKLGVAVQIRDDLDELWHGGDGRGSAGDEVLNKKKLLPVVYALEQADIREKRRLGEIYLKRVLEPDDVVAVRASLEELGARQYCEETVAAYRRQAESALDVPGVSPEGASAIKAFMASLVGP